MNIVITGSSGYLGYNLAEYLSKNKYLNIYSSSRKDENKPNIFYLNLHKDFDKFFLISKKIDLIIHAAFSFNYFSLKEGIDKNQTVTEKLFLFAKNNNIKIIYISSISSFDKAKSNYGKIKFYIEKIAKKNNILVIRPGLIYSNSKSDGIFGKISNAIISLPIIPIIDNGKNTQYMCNINDLCLLIEKIIISKDFDYKIVYAFNPNPITLYEIVKRISFKFKKRRILIFLPSRIILIILKFFEFFKLNFGIKSDSLISFLNPAKINDYKLNKYGVIFNDFKEDYRIR